MAPQGRDSVPGGLHQRLLKSLQQLSICFSERELSNALWLADKYSTIISERGLQPLASPKQLKQLLKPLLQALAAACNYSCNIQHLQAICIAVPALQECYLKVLGQAEGGPATHRPPLGRSMELAAETGLLEALANVCPLVTSPLKQASMQPQDPNSMQQQKGPSSSTADPAVFTLSTIPLGPQIIKEAAYRLLMLFVTLANGADIQLLLSDSRVAVVLPAMLELAAAALFAYQSAAASAASILSRGQPTAAAAAASILSKDDSSSTGRRWNTYSRHVYWALKVAQCVLLPACAAACQSSTMSAGPSSLAFKLLRSGDSCKLLMALLAGTAQNMHHGLQGISPSKLPRPGSTNTAGSKNAAATNPAAAASSSARSKQQQEQGEGSGEKEYQLLAAPYHDELLAALGLAGYDDVQLSILHSTAAEQLMPLDHVRTTAHNIATTMLTMGLTGPDDTPDPSTLATLVPAQLHLPVALVLLELCVLQPECELLGLAMTAVHMLSQQNAVWGAAGVLNMGSAILGTRVAELVDLVKAAKAAGSAALGPSAEDQRQRLAIAVLTQLAPAALYALKPRRATLRLSGVGAEELLSTQRLLGEMIGSCTISISLDPGLPGKNQPLFAAAFKQDPLAASMAMEAHYRFIMCEEPSRELSELVDGIVCTVMEALSAPSATAASAAKVAASPLTMKHMLALLVTCLKCMQKQQTADAMTLGAMTNITRTALLLLRAVTDAAAPAAVGPNGTAAAASSSSKAGIKVNSGSSSSSSTVDCLGKMNMLWLAAHGASCLASQLDSLNVQPHCQPFAPEQSYFEYSMAHLAAKCCKPHQLVAALCDCVMELNTLLTLCCGSRTSSSTRSSSSNNGQHDDGLRIPAQNALPLQQQAVQLEAQLQGALAYCEEQADAEFDSDSSDDSTDPLFGLYSTLKAAVGRKLAQDTAVFCAAVRDQLLCRYCCNEPTCGNLDRNSEVLCASSRCTRCKLARYCSPECQTKHWKQHKGVCKRWKPLKG